MKARTYTGVALVVGLLTLFGCESLLIEPDVEPTPVAVFEDLWQGFDRYCGNFETRGVDWDAVYASFRPRIYEGMTDEALFDVLAEMLYHFRDPHVWLVAPDRAFYSMDRRARLEGLKKNYNQALIAHKYLKDQVTELAEGRLRYGRFAGSEGPIGYLYIRDFKGGRDDPWFDQLNAVLDSLRDTRGLILDLRDNDGGNGIRARDFAGRFADRERLWLVTQSRNGPGRDEFGPPFTHYLRPTGDWQYRQPVVVLTSRFTISAGEWFTLAMRELPQATIVGDTTIGTTGSVHERELINGWRYALSYQKTIAADGVNYDGTGVPPDVYQIVTTTDIFVQIDPILERGIAEVRAALAGGSRPSGPVP